ncbi:hypothetical protein CJ195_15875 [Bacillus sp. UMB0899]|nr:hypothetical protein CJ195_15875 [Bacillus sp. UMB0899]
MDYINELLHIPSLWMLIIGIIAVIFTLKVVKKMIVLLIGILFSLISIYRLYLYVATILH